MEAAGADWRGGGGGGGGMGPVESSHYWQPGSSGEVIYEPISPHLASSNPVPAASGYGGNPNVGPQALSRPPPPSDSEPLYKKSRSDPPHNNAVPGSGYGSFCAPAPLAPPGLAAGTESYMYPGQGYGGVDVPGYADSGEQSYGYENYGGYTYQQAPSYEGDQQSGTAFSQRSFGSGGGGGGRGRGLSSLFYKTKLCNNYKSGTCSFNEKCSFAHGTEELRRPPSGWQQMMSSPGNPGPGGGRGTGGNAGSVPNEQRSFRGRLCKFFVQGNCPYGDRCSFSHSDEDDKNSGSANAGMRRSTRHSRWEKESQNYYDSSSFKNNGSSGSDSQQSNRPNMLATGANKASSSVLTTNANVYQNPGTIAQSSPGLLDPNGSASNMGHWDQGKKWNNASSGVGQATPYMEPYAQLNQGYNQSSETGPWMPGYSADQFSRKDADDGSNQYANQQQYTGSIFRGGATQFAMQAQDLSTEYGPIDFPNEY